MNLHGLEGGIFALNNPHNQFLLFALQIGLAGLLIYLAYLALLFKQFANQAEWQSIGIAFLVAFCVGNLFNSFHFDMSESVLFVIGVSALWNMKVAQGQLF